MIRFCVFLLFRLFQLLRFYVQRLLFGIRDETRFCAFRFFYVFHFRIIDRHRFGMPRFAVVSGKCCRFHERLFRWVGRFDDDVRAGNVQRMKPDVFFMGELMGDVFILFVVSSDVDDGAVG